MILSAMSIENRAIADVPKPTAFGTSDGANGDITCDGYHKYKEDVKLMSNMGLEAFRFSISWSRLIPSMCACTITGDEKPAVLYFFYLHDVFFPIDGSEPVNPKGLQFYNNLINELISHGIQPHVTLHHFDLPQALDDEYGGWLSRKIVKDFTAYADVCFREFGDRVLHWTTVNEANIFAIGGYDQGSSPPGRCSPPAPNVCSMGNSSTEPYIVGHNIILAHSAVARLYKKKCKATQRGYIGFSIYNLWMVPRTNSKEDVIATQRANDLYVGWLLDPLIFGDYPEIVRKNAKTRIPVFTEAESKQIKDTIDFIGVNHYTTAFVKDNPSSLQTDDRDLIADMAIDLQSRKTRRNGTLEDTARVEYLHAYIGAVLEAVRNGSNTKAYLVWTFLDCFELLDGFESSYGMYYVDLDDKDLKRTPKLSAHWYSNFLKGKSIESQDIAKLGEHPSVFL